MPDPIRDQDPVAERVEHGGVALEGLLATTWPVATDHAVRVECFERYFVANTLIPSEDSRDSKTSPSAMTVRVPSAGKRRIRLDVPCLFIVLTTYDVPLFPRSRTTAPFTGIRTSPSTTVLPSRCGIATSAPRGRAPGLISWGGATGRRGPSGPPPR